MISVARARPLSGHGHEQLATGFEEAEKAADALAERLKYAAADVDYGSVAVGWGELPRGRPALCRVSVGRNRDYGRLLRVGLLRQVLTCT